MQWLGLGFGVLVLTVLVLDLGVFHRKAHQTSVREAAIWTVVWVLLALGFNVAVYFMRGHTAALEFLTGYIVEWSLSMDNVFVFAVLFTCFGVPREYQHRVLFWGIVGAVVMRLAFIIMGAALLERFHWVIYVFGALVLLAGIRMITHRPEDLHPERNVILKLASRYLRVTKTYVGQRFLVRQDGVLYATPLLLVLLVVEASDVMFAVDSIPAIFAITRDPFIVFTSNVFAILGLRSLYFLLAGVMGIFKYLDKGLSVILCFIGVKMLLTDVYHLPVAVSLGVVLFILAVSIVFSLIASRKEPGLGVSCPVPECSLLPQEPEETRGTD